MAMKAWSPFTSVTTAGSPSKAYPFRRLQGTPGAQEAPAASIDRPRAIAALTASTASAFVYAGRAPHRTRSMTPGVFRIGDQEVSRWLKAMKP